MRRFKYIARAAVAVLAASVGVAVLPQPAAAVTLPPLKFAAVSLAPNLTHPQTLVSQKDGGVTVGDCGSGISNDGFQQYSTTGTLAQNAANTVSGRPISFCDKQAAVGADGTVYTVAFNPSTNKDVLLAFQGGTQQWVYAPPCATISAVELGTNGNIYMLASGSSACSGQRLLGIEPTLATGQTTPTVVANTILYRNLPYRGGLSPYSGGVIVRYLDGVGFFTYTGTQQQEYTVPAGAYDGGPFATVNGWAMVPILDQAPRPFNCQNDTQAAEYVVAYSVSGVVWSNQLPDCTRVDAIRPMPDGGVVALVKLRDNNLQTLTQHFVGIAPETGQAFRWMSGSLAPESGVVRYGHSFVTDLNGNLVTQQHLKRNAGSADYFEIVTSTSSGYTGIGFGSVTFAGGPSDGYGFSPPAGLGLIPAITDDTVYAALAQCNGSGYCTPSTTKLYAASVPGMAMDYPRGAVLKYNEPWLDYVALGDSFSSGEGVPGFEAGTDTAGPPENRCHRSEGAYSRLVDGRPGLRLNLTRFAACSGATTAQVTGVWPEDKPNSDESAQVSHLDAGVDVVTISIGGNDAQFKEFAARCVLADCSIYRQYYTGLANQLSDALSDTYDEILSGAPNAQIYVLGYPLMLSPDGCTQTDAWMHVLNTLAGQAASSDAAAILALQQIADGQELSPYDEGILLTSGSVQISQSELDLAHDFTTAINTKINAVVGTKGARMHFADPMAPGSPFLGHELCSGSEFFNPLVVGQNAAFTFHPNANGQAAYAQLLATMM